MRLSSTRIASIYVPLFPLASRLRCEPELTREALAIFEGNAHAARVVAATRLAREAGIRPGLTLAQARSLQPKLVARARDPESERTAQEALLEVAETFSPRVEDTGEGVAYLDIGGLERHFPGKSPEKDLGRALIHALEQTGLPAWVGIASSKLAARVAAGLPHSPTVVPSGQEARFLAPLPLERLSPELEVATTLKRWGIHSIGEFARLPKSEVASRLGEIGGELHATARGLDPRPLIPRQPPPSFREGMSLEWPLVSLEPFLFIARAALDRLCQRLESRGLGCLRLELSLRLEPDGYAERTIELPSPTREAKTLLTLIRLELEAHPPGAPLNGFTFTAHPDRPRAAQLSLLGPAALSPDRLATTLARLFALLGPNRVGSPRTVNGHRPERFRLVEYAPPPPPKVPDPEQPGRGLLTIRVLRPPVELEVITAESPPPSQPSEVREDPSPFHSREGSSGDGLRLISVQSLIQEGTDKKTRIQGKVRVASGPWEIEEAWWSEDPVQRHYWDVELSDGGLYRIFRDQATSKWFADGIYD